MESAVFIGFLCASFVVYLVVLCLERLERQSEGQKLQDAYEAALALLVADPSNEDLQRKVLHLGGVYDNLIAERRRQAGPDALAGPQDEHSLVAGD